MITLPPGTRAACFIRVSSDGQVRDESPAVHLARTQEYCELNGWNVVAVYQLDAVSGATVLDHPETKRMWRDVEHDRIDVLVFSAVARVGRDLLELLTIEKHLRTHGKYLASTRRGVIDTSTPEGMASFVNEGARAQDERLELSARVRAGLKQRAKMGQITAAFAPYGYRKALVGKSRSLEIDPMEGPIRVLMHDLYMRHQRLYIVANELNERGYRNRRGKPFCRQQIKQILLESSASGIYYANKTLRPGVLKPKSEWIPIQVPVLIDPDEWQRCYDLIEGRSKAVRIAVYPYSGLLVCHCGTKMYVRAALNHCTQAEWFPPLYECRGCGNKIKLHELNKSIGEIFTGFLIEGLPDNAEIEQNKIDLLLKGLRSELKHVTAGKYRWVEAFQAGALDLNMFATYHNPLVERERAIIAEIDHIEAEQRTNKEQLAAQERAAQMLQLVAWDDLEAQEKQALLREFVHDITLGLSDIRIRLFYTPTALKLAEPGFAQTHIITSTRPDYVGKPADRHVWTWYLRKVRKERGESTNEAAAKMGVRADVLSRWESRSIPPGPNQIPKIIEYMGFIPWERTPGAQSTLTDAMRVAREIRGVNQSDIARALGVKQPVISKVELTLAKVQNSKLADQIEQLLEIDVRRIFRIYHHE